MDATDSVQSVHNSQPSLDPDALERAFAQHQGELMGTLYYMIGNAEDARDALQETFLKCWRNRDKLSEVRQLRPWIFRIAVNTARDMRKTAWCKRRQALFNDGAEIVDAMAEPKEQLSQQEQMQHLRLAIQQLRPEEQEVFLLRQNGDLTYDQIAAALDIPSGTVKTRMRLALLRLRQAVE